MYKDRTLNVKPKELEQRGGAYYSYAACEVINAIYNDKQAEHYVERSRSRAHRQYPGRLAVEMTCILGREGAKPHPALPTSTIR
ncbi:family 4 glycosyl hydrolase [Enterobacter hormaechei]